MKRIASALLVFSGCLGLAASRPLFAQAVEHSMYVTALDKSGAPVPNLGPSDVVVREDDVAREILRVTPANDPMRIAVLIDNSQAGEPHIRDYREALAAFIASILEGGGAGPRHQISLIGLASRPTVLRDYTSDAQQLTETAQRIFSEADSGTYLLDAIYEIGAGLEKTDALRPVIVAITTEGPELSNRQFPMVLDKLSASGAAFHVVVVGRPINESVDRTIVITRGPKESGGSYSNIFTGMALVPRMKELAAELTHQYRVTYARPQRLIPPERITVSGARPDIVVRGTAAVEPSAPEKR